MKLLGTHTHKHNHKKKPRKKKKRWLKRLQAKKIRKQNIIYSANLEKSQMWLRLSFLAASERTSMPDTDKITENVSSSERRMMVKMTLELMTQTLHLRNAKTLWKRKLISNPITLTVSEWPFFLLLSTPHFHGFLPSGQKSTRTTILLPASLPQPHTCPRPLHTYTHQDFSTTTSTHAALHPSISGRIQIVPNINSAVPIKTRGSPLRSHVSVQESEGKSPFPLRPAINNSSVSTKESELLCNIYVKRANGKSHKDWDTCVGTGETGKVLMSYLFQCQQHARMNESWLYICSGRISSKKWATNQKYSCDLYDSFVFSSVHKWSKWTAFYVSLF